MGTITLGTVCPSCQKPQMVEVQEADLKKWKDGAYIQDAFPALSKDEREILLSGFCGECWDKLFADEE